MPKTNGHSSGDNESSKQKEYNDIPVEWCARCKSLKIISNDKTSYELTGIECYCGNCNSTSLNQGHIGEWNKEYLEYTFNDIEVSEYDIRMEKEKRKKEEKKDKGSLSFNLEKW